MQLPISHKLSSDGDALVHLIAGRLPGDEERRFEILDAPRYRIARLLEEHERARAIIKDCQRTGRPLCLFLRNFSVESHSDAIPLNLGILTIESHAQMIQSESASVQAWLQFQLAPRSVSLLKLHGGSDGLYPGLEMDLPEVGILSTSSDNWLPVVTELISAASLIVVFVSDLAAGLMHELSVVRSCGQQPRCLVLIQDPGRTFQAERPQLSELRNAFGDFPHVYDLPRQVSFGHGISREARAAMEQLLDAGKTNHDFTQSLAAEFGYLEPEFLASEAHHALEQYVWERIHVARTELDDRYWRAVKANGIEFRHVRLAAPWQMLHQIYGLAVAVGDFPAIAESLGLLSLVYYLRASLYGINVKDLARRFGELGAKVGRAHRKDTEAQYLQLPDAFKLGAQSMGGALTVFEQAQTCQSEGDLATACWLYQVAFIRALGCSELDATEQQSALSSMLHDWAKAQAAAGVLDWAELNYRYSLKLGRELAQANPDRFEPEVAICLNNLGSLFWRAGDLGSAREMFSMALKIRESRPTQEPDYVVNLATSLLNCGVLEEAVNDVNAARRFYERALEQWQVRADRQPDGIVDLAVQQIKIGYFLAATAKDKAAAAALMRKAHENLASVARINPAKAAELTTYLAHAEAEAVKP